MNIICVKHWRNFYLHFQIQASIRRSILWAASTNAPTKPGTQETSISHSEETARSTICVVSSELVFHIRVRQSFVSFAILCWSVSELNRGRALQQSQVIGRSVRGTTGARPLRQPATVLTWIENDWERYGNRTSGSYRPLHATNKLPGRSECSRETGHQRAWFRLRRQSLLSKTEVAASDNCCRAWVAL